MGMVFRHPNTATRLQRVRRAFRELFFDQTHPTDKSILQFIVFLSWKTIRLMQKLMSQIIHAVRAPHSRSRARKLGFSDSTIGVLMFGGVGDYIVIARFMRDFAFFLDAKFDIYSNRPFLAKWVFTEVEGFRDAHDSINFNRSTQYYMASFQISQSIYINESWIMPGLEAVNRRLATVVTSIRSMTPAFATISKNDPHLDNLVAQKAIYLNRSRKDFLHYMAGIDYSSDRMPLECSRGARTQFGLNAIDYITVHNGYDPNMFATPGRATKCYPHFGAVIKLVRQRFPQIKFVQLGTHTSQKIDEVDYPLMGHTSLHEAAALLRGSLLHLDNESGLVHLASALGTKCCVVFGPTPKDYFGYPGNVNIAPAFCGGCWWVTETWMNHCPRGFNGPRCLCDQEPSSVAVKVIAAIQSLEAKLT